MWHLFAKASRPPTPTLPHKGEGSRDVEPVEQRTRSLRRIVHTVFCRREVTEQRHDARWNIEANCVTGATRSTWIIGHRHGDAPLCAWPPLQTHKGGDTVG